MFSIGRAFIILFQYLPAKNSFASDNALDLIEFSGLTVGFLPFPHPYTIPRLVCATRWIRFIDKYQSPFDRTPRTFSNNGVVISTGGSKAGATWTNNVPRDFVRHTRLQRATCIIEILLLLLFLLLLQLLLLLLYRYYYDCIVIIVIMENAEYRSTSRYKRLGATLF